MSGGRPCQEVVHVRRSSTSGGRLCREVVYGDRFDRAVTAPDHGDLLVCTLLSRAAAGCFFCVSARRARLGIDALSRAANVCSLLQLIHHYVGEEWSMRYLID
jgi:hypothetical protein